MTAVGVVGVGRMGLPLAVNLLADGFEVHGYRRGPNDELERAGGVAAESPAAVATAADVVFTPLASPEALEEVVGGDRGLLAGGRAGLVVVDLSTLPLPAKQRAHAALATAGIEMLDAPMSGIPPMVAARRAIAFVSGSPAAYERARAPLAALGKAPYVGEFGTGSKLKFVAATLIALHTAAAAEAMALAAAAGLDPKLVIDTITQSVASSTIFEFRAPVMAERRFRPAGGTINLTRKDVQIVREFVRDAGVAVPLLDRAAALYDVVAEAGGGEDDITAVLTAIERLAEEKAPDASAARP